VWNIVLSREFHLVFVKRIRMLETSDVRRAVIIKLISKVVFPGNTVLVILGKEST
jgi:hypothetical protein